MKYLLNSPAPAVSLNGTERGHTLQTYRIRAHTLTHTLVVLISLKLAAQQRLSQRDCERRLSVYACARLCLIGPYWSVKTLPPQSACVCSLLTNMLSCGFVFVSSGLIAASAVFINVRVQCVRVCVAMRKSAGHIGRGSLFSPNVSQLERSSRVCLPALNSKRKRRQKLSVYV